MSLITRCPACATMFKVVPDQLRISAGWVRCGVCGEIFDAMPQMLPEAEGRRLESMGPVSAAAPFAESAAHSPVSKSDRLLGYGLSESEGVQEPFDPVPEEGPGLRGTLSGVGEADDVASNAGVVSQGAAFTLAPPIDDVLFARSEKDLGLADVANEERTEGGEDGGTAANCSPVGADFALLSEGKWTPPAYLQAAVQLADSPRESVPEEIDKPRQDDSDLLLASVAPETKEPTEALKPTETQDTEDTSDERWWPRAESGGAALAAGEAGEAAISAEPVPSFVKQARRRAFLRSRGVRVVWWLAVTLLALGLGLQWAVAQRDWLAAKEPRLAPLLDSLCRPMNCVVSPYRDLNAIVIDGSSFQRVAPDSFRLNVSLRNNGDLPVAPPALELTLTDAQDQVLLRRVLTADEMSAPRTLNARGEFNGSSAVSVGASDPAAIVGYRLTAFYP